MSYQGTLRVVLISTRDDVILFCKNVYTLSACFRVERNPEPSCFSDSCIFIIDASLLSVSSNQLLDAIKNNLQKIIFLIPSDLHSCVNDFISRNGLNKISFPVVPEIFKEYVFSVSSKLCGKEKIISPYIAKAKSVELANLFKGTSEAIKCVRGKIEYAASRDRPVLILGETGTGKTTAASLIHQLSARHNKPFLPLNVSTISDSLACSTLFGTTSGAFTDAVSKSGLLKAADGGIVFLDEIGMASISLQAMLLTVIETGMMHRVGSDICEHVDVMMIFATNASIENMMKNGSFRSDLFFRISECLINIPPLRERIEDIRILADSFAESKGKTISDEVIAAMEKYYWPGNVRELQHCVYRACELCRETKIGLEYIDFGLFNE